jgi:signal transduction histidine kinase
MTARGDVSRAWAWLARSALWWSALIGPAWALAQTPESMLTLDQAVLHRGTGSEAVVLPHVIAGPQAPEAGARVRYHVSFDLAQAPTAPMGLFLQRVSRSGRVFLNGHEIGSCAPGALETLRCVRAPIWLQAPPELWQAGRNTIEVEVYINRMQMNGLSPIVIGPAATVYGSAYQPQRFFSQDLTGAVQWGLFAISLIALLVGGLYRGEGQRLFLWFGLACLLRGLSMYYAVLVEVWVDMVLTQWLFTMARLVSIPIMLLVLLALREQRWRWLERALVGYACILPVGVLLVDARVNDAIVLAMPGVIATLVVLALVGWKAWTARHPTDILLATTIVVLIAVGLHDAWALTQPAAFLKPQMLPYTTGIVLLVLGGLIMSRLTQALTRAGNLNMILNQRVREAQASLEDQHRTIVALERRTARTDERERLLRDLHDGMGSSLATARIQLDNASLSPAQIRQLLDDCIEDLRLLLDTSEPDGHLRDALASLRHRLSQRLQGLPVAIVWTLDLQQLPPLSPPARLQILRILQEALTNALRHAHARRIDIRAEFEPTRGLLRLQVNDNGRGLPHAVHDASPIPSNGLAPKRSAPTGRGLANMRLRAHRLGAHLQIRSQEPGTQVLLEWPVPPDSAAA